MGVPLTAFVAVVGAISLAVSLALQDVLKNLVAGLIILVERPFTIGEHIDFKTFSGVVETIELRTTVLRTPTGQRVVIPNAMIFSDTLVNRSAYGRQLVRLRVTVPLEADGDGAGAAGRLRSGARRREVLRAIRSTETGGRRAAARRRRRGRRAPGPPGPAGRRPAGPAAPRPAGRRRWGRPARPAAPPRRRPPRRETPHPSVLVESLTEEKATLRVEAWTRRRPGRRPPPGLGPAPAHPGGRDHRPGMSPHPPPVPARRARRARAPRAIGVLGGTFDPIHHAHLFTAEVAAAACGLERVLLVPASQSPLKSPAAGTPEERVAMARLAAAGNPLLEVSTVEVGPPPAVLHGGHPGAPGRATPRRRADPDPGHRRPAGPAAVARPGARPRPGPDRRRLPPRLRPGRPPGLAARLGARTERIALQPMPQLEISSTEIRRRFAAGEPVRYLLPEAVERYARRRGLYRPGRRPR